MKIPLEGLLPVQERGLFAHDPLVGETHRQTAVLHIIIVGRGDVLPLVRPSRAHGELTDVARRAEAHAMERLAVESHGQLIHNRVHIVWDELRPAETKTEGKGRVAEGRREGGCGMHTDGRGRAGGRRRKEDGIGDGANAGKDGAE